MYMGCMGPRTLLLALVACTGTSTDTPDPAETPVGVDTSETDDTVVDTVPDTDDTPDPADTGPVDVSLELGDAVVCADPSLRESAPLVLHEPGGDWADQFFNPRSGSLFVGGSVLVADLDGDDLLDIMLPDLDDRFQYFGGTAGLGFEDRSDLVPPMPVKTVGVTAVDLEGDGDLDVVVTVFKGRNVVLVNDGAGNFTNEAAALGLEGGATNRTMSSSWADIDGDGDLDGFLGGYGRLSQQSGGLPDGDASMIVIRESDGTYTDIVPTYDLPHPLHTAHTFGGAFTDVDLDGDQDLYMVNDFGWVYPSLILRNENGRLEWWEDSGSEQPRENMGLGVGDVNGDELPDFLVAAWDRIGLFASRSGTWFDISQARSLEQDFTRGQRVAWGAELADLDNDIDLDAIVVHGYLDVRSNNVNPDDQPDALFLRQEDGSYVDVAPTWGFDDDFRSRGFVVVDLDRDGWLDVVKRDLRGPTRIYLANCGTASWMGIDVRQPGANPFGIGTRIRIVNAEGGVATREIRAGGTSYASAGPPEVHFGLGEWEAAAELEILWPDGRVDHFDDVPARRYVRVVRR
jgi:hypothetical protein